MQAHETRGSKGDGVHEEEALAAGQIAAVRGELRVPYAEDLQEILDSVRKIAEHEGVGKAVGSGKKKSIGCKHGQTCDAILYLLRELNGWLVSAKQKGLIRGIKAAEDSQVEARRGGSNDGSTRHAAGRWSGYDIISGVISNVREISELFVKKHTEALQMACSESMVLLGLESPPVPKVSAGLPKWVKDKLMTEQGISELVKVALTQKLYSAEWTVNKMEESMEDELDLESGRIRLNCPVSARRMKVAAKSVHCAHLDCFDLQTHLMLNARRHLSSKTWKCPHCKQSASWNELIVDAYVQRILQEAENAVEVQIFMDATWRPVEESSEPCYGAWECSSSSSEECELHEDQGPEFSTAGTEDTVDGRAPGEQATGAAPGKALVKEGIATQAKTAVGVSLWHNKLSVTLERCSIVEGTKFPEVSKQGCAAHNLSGIGFVEKDCSTKGVSAVEPLAIDEDVDLVGTGSSEDKMEGEVAYMDQVQGTLQQKGRIGSYGHRGEEVEWYDKHRDVQVRVEDKEAAVSGTFIEGKLISSADSGSRAGRLTELEQGKVDLCRTDSPDKKLVAGMPVPSPNNHDIEHAEEGEDIMSQLCPCHGKDGMNHEGKGDASVARTGGPQHVLVPTTVIDLTLDDDDEEEEEEGGVPVAEETRPAERWTSSGITHQPPLVRDGGKAVIEDNDQDVSGAVCVTTEEREVDRSVMWRSQRTERQQSACQEQDIHDKLEDDMSAGVMHQERGVLSQDRVWLQERALADNVGIVSHKSSDSRATKRKRCGASTSGHSADQDVNSCSKRGSTSGCLRGDSEAECVLVSKGRPTESPVKHASAGRGNECRHYADSGVAGAVAFGVPITDPIEEVASPSPLKKAVLATEAECDPRQGLAALAPCGLFGAPGGLTIIQYGVCKRAETENGTVVRNTWADSGAVPSHNYSINADSASTRCGTSSNGPVGEPFKGGSYNDHRDSCTAVRSGNDLRSYSAESTGDVAGGIGSCRVKLQEDDTITNSAEDVDVRNVMAEVSGFVSGRTRPMGCRSMLRMARGRGAVLVRAMESPTTDRNHMDGRRGMAGSEERSASAGSTRGQLRKPDEALSPLEVQGSFLQEALHLRGQDLSSEVCAGRSVVLGDQGSGLVGVADETSAKIEQLENLARRVFDLFGPSGGAN